MPVFAIYKIVFDRSRQKNLYQKETGESAFNKAQELLAQVLLNSLPVTKEKRDKTLVPLENYVKTRRDDISLLVICNEKEHKYKEKEDSRTLEYHPGCYVIIDNRPGVAQIAIERSTSFDSKTDKVRDLLEEALSKCFDEYGLTVEIRSKWRTGTFWEAVNEQFGKYNDTISRVVWDFPHEDEGPIDASETQRNKLTLLRSVGAALNAVKGQVKWEAEKNDTLRLDQTKEDVSQLVALCANNGYNISVHFRHYGVYRFGSKIMALSMLKEDVLNEFISGQTMLGKTVEGRFELTEWLDNVRKTTEGYTDDEPIEKKPTRRHKK